LLRDLLHEPLGHRLPQHYVPFLCGYVFEFSTIPVALNIDDIAMGILATYPLAEPLKSNVKVNWATIPYYSISLSLNILLTLMIVIRLILHGRNVRIATGSSAGISGLYNTIATMLIESSALFAVSALLVIGPMATNDISLLNLTAPILTETQVRASRDLYHLGVAV